MTLPYNEPYHHSNGTWQKRSLVLQLKVAVSFIEILSREYVPNVFPKKYTPNIPVAKSRIRGATFTECQPSKDISTDD